MRKSPLFLMLTIALMLATPVEAKNRDGAWEISVMDFSMNPDDKFDIDNSFGPALSVGYHFSATIEVELFTFFTSTDIEGGIGPGPVGNKAFGMTEADYLRTTVSITGNFLTDRDGSTIPYVSAGLGIIRETREACDTNADPSCEPQLESFDSSAALSLALGARTFFTDWFGIRYELRYYHHDSFDLNQDEFAFGFGATFLMGGDK